MTSQYLVRFCWIYVLAFVSLRAYLAIRILVVTKGDLIMNTTASTTFHSSALIPNRTLTAVKNDYSQTIFTKIRINANRLIYSIDRVAAGGSEKFYQDHVTAIFLALYAEIALGLLMGMLVVYLFSPTII
jgi:hypothetical protein